MATKHPRLYSPKKVKLPKPRLTGKKRGSFELKTINMADQRFHVVKQLRLRVQRLLEDANADTLAKEMLAARAAYIAGYLESLEVDGLNGKDMNWGRYFQAVRALSDVLNKLGLDRAQKTTQRLSDYIVDATKTKNGHSKVAR